MSKAKANQADSIVITLAQKTIAERRGGMVKIATEWREADGEESTWWYKLGTAPKNDKIINWVYWVIAGRIRWRCRLAGVDRNSWKQFSQDSTAMFGKAWLILFDFEQIPRNQQREMKGFQGFRYFNDEHFT